MAQLLTYGLFALACPIGMGLMMFFMMRGMRGKSDEHANMPGMSGASGKNLAQLEAEKAALERQIASAKDRDHMGADPVAKLPKG